MIIQYIKLDFINLVWMVEFTDLTTLNLPYENTFIKYKNELEELYNISINTIVTSVYTTNTITFNNDIVVNCSDLPIDLFNEFKMFFKSIKSTVIIFKS